MQSQIVLEDLTVRVSSQATMLHRQVKLTQLAESLRAQLSRLSTFQVQSEACIYLQNVLATVLVSSDQLLFKRSSDSLDEYPSQVKLLNYACCLNSGVLTGEPLKAVPMIAYLNRHQN